MKNKYTKTIKSVALAGLLGLSSLLGNAKAGDVSGNIGYVQREETKSSYAEANAFYKLPFDVRGYTFLDLYNQDGGVFGKTTLTREIADSGISARVQAIHGNELCTDVGLGLEAKIPTPKGVTAKVNCTPIWINSDGKEDDTIKVGYFVALDLPWNMALSSFGEANVASPKGITWKYGEVELAKKIGNLSIGYNAGLECKEDGIATPKINNGIAIRYKF
jgi:hypothetical protein